MERHLDGQGDPGSAKHPEAIVGDFSTPNPLVTFRKEDIAFTYGSKWKQRYFTKRGDDYFVFPAQWDIRAKTWRRYYVEPGTDWWVEHYPADQMQRPTGPLCDGCHSVNYDITTKTVTEWNVGCEKCHGPGSLHLDFPVASTIVNPARLDAVRADDVCIQCHSQGQPRTKPLGGVYYDWPVGYRPGDRLSETWMLEEHHLGKETFTHWPDGTAHKNRMQGNDYVQSQMSLKGVRCSGCHDVHGTPYEADLRLSGDAVCLQCHSPQLQPGPRGSVEQHTQHKIDSAGSRCIARRSRGQSATSACAVTPSSSSRRSRRNGSACRTPARRATPIACRTGRSRRSSDGQLLPRGGSLSNHAFVRAAPHPARTARPRAAARTCTGAERATLCVPLRARVQGRADLDGREPVSGASH